MGLTNKFNLQNYAYYDIPFARAISRKTHVMKAAFSSVPECNHGTYQQVGTRGQKPGWVFS